METIRAAGCCSAPPRTWTLTLANQEHSKVGQHGLAPPTTKNDASPQRAGSPPRAGFPLPYIMTPLPDPKAPIVTENNAEDLPPLGPDQSDESASETPYKPFVEPGRSDEYYKRYLQLAERVAHKYPNPGLPVERHGRAGASWRHIKEVQSHNNRVLYVDGIVRLYDKDYITSFASRNLPLGMARQTPRVREASHAQTGQIDLNWPSTQKARPINVTTSFLPGNPVKYKGFYNYK